LERPTWAAVSPGTGRGQFRAEGPWKQVRNSRRWPVGSLTPERWYHRAMTSSYRLRTQWRLASTTADVRGVLDDVLSLPQWWPSVYLTVALLEEGGSDGIGRRVRLRTTGWLPYTLTWTSILTQPVTERGFSFRATGDFEGTGEWVFRQDGPEVVLTFDWQIGVNKPIVRRMTWLFRPVFAANHRWAMAQGQESLLLELRRRGGFASMAADNDPAPPGPTFRWLRRRKLRP
jgi:hypothetical protein